jgi:glyoxalase-like protein
MTAVVDHAVINVLYRMDAAVERFRALGFTLTERGYHSLGSINHLMMFDTDYLELVGVEHDAKPVRREVADGPPGLNGLVFATDDADSLYRQLAAKGVPVEPPLAFSRPVTIDDVAHRASFRTVRVGADYAHGGRVYFCQHETRELVWREQWQRHRNGVHGLAGFVIVLADPACEAARYQDIVGGTPQHLSAHESEIVLGACTIAFMTPQHYKQRFGACACDDGGRDAFMGALSLRTTSLGLVRECLAGIDAMAGGPVKARFSPARITVAAASAFNAVLEFVE